MSFASATTDMLAEIACYRWCSTLLGCLVMSLYRRNRYHGVQTSSILRLASSTLAPHDGHIMSERELISTWAHQSSPLLNILAEIRNRIYRDVLISEGPMSCTPRSFPPKIRPLHVCQQMRAEVEPIYWAEYDFLAIVEAAWPKGIESWVRMIGRRRANMITRLSIKINFTQEYRQACREKLDTVLRPHSRGVGIVANGLKLLQHELDGVLAGDILQTSIKIVDPEPPGQSPDNVERIVATNRLVFNAKVRAILELPPNEGNDHSWKDVLADGTFIVNVVQEARRARN